MVRLRFNHETKLWDEIPKGEPKTDRDIVFSRLWKNLLDRARKDIDNDQDITVLFCGEVGAGKSTFAKLSCRYMSNEEFDPHIHLVKNVGDIKKAMMGATKGKGAVLFDEASKMASATNTMTKGTKYFHEVLDVCRQRNLFIALCAPAFHRLTSQLAVDRTKVLARIYIHNKDGTRGHYAFYGSKAKEKLYLYSKSNYGSMKFPKPKYRGHFGNDLLNQEVYIDIKDQTFQDTLASLDTSSIAKPPTAEEVRREYRLDLVRRNIDKSTKEMIEMLGVSARTVGTLRQEAKKQIARRDRGESMENTQIVGRTAPEASYTNTPAKEQNPHPPTT